MSLSGRRHSSRRPLDPQFQARGPLLRTCPSPQASAVNRRRRTVEDATGHTRAYTVGYIHGTGRAVRRRGRPVPARYVAPPEPLPVEVCHDDGRWLSGWAHGWHGERVFVRFTDPAARVAFCSASAWRPYGDGGEDDTSRRRSRDRGPMSVLGRPGIDEVMRRRCRTGGLRGPQGRRAARSSHPFGPAAPSLRATQPAPVAAATPWDSKP